MSPPLLSDDEGGRNGDGSDGEGGDGEGDDGEDSEEDEPDENNLFLLDDSSDADDDLDPYIEAKKFCNQMSMDIGDNKMTQTASTRILKNFRNTYGKFLPTPVQALIPLDWRGCRALAGRAHDPPYF